MKISLSKQLGTTLTALLVIVGMVTVSCGSHEPTVKCGEEIGEKPVKDFLRPGKECRVYFSATPGEIVTIEMDRIDGSLDPSLALFGPDGSLVAYNDDDPENPGSLDSRILEWSLNLDGTYIIVASSYDEEGSGQFVLTLERFGGLGSILPRESGSTIGYEEYPLTTIERWSQTTTSPELIPW